MVVATRDAAEEAAAAMAKLTVEDMEPSAVKLTAAESGASDESDDHHGASESGPRSQDAEAERAPSTDSAETQDGNGESTGPKGPLPPCRYDQVC